MPTESTLGLLKQSIEQANKIKTILNEETKRGVSNKTMSEPVAKEILRRSSRHHERLLTEVGQIYSLLQKPRLPVRKGAGHGIRPTVLRVVSGTRKKCMTRDEILTAIQVFKPRDKKWNEDGLNFVLHQLVKDRLLEKTKRAEDKRRKRPTDHRDYFYHITRLGIEEVKRYRSA